MELVEGSASIDEVDAFVGQLEEIGDRHDCVIQAFDARYIAGRRHLETALERAQRAFDRNDAIADEFAVEILCYAAGRRQINQALEMGISPGDLPVVIVVTGPNEQEAAAEVKDLIQPEPTLGNSREPERIHTFFDITDAERDATDASLEDLVIERVSLLVIDK